MNKRQTHSRIKEIDRTSGEDGYPALRIGDFVNSGGTPQAGFGYIGSHLLQSLEWLHPAERSCQSCIVEKLKDIERSGGVAESIPHAHPEEPMSLSISELHPPFINCVGNRYTQRTQGVAGTAEQAAEDAFI